MSDAPLPPSTSGPASAGEPAQPGDAERDAWLRAALSHAPDADASPPDVLRRSILDQARAAAFASAQAGHRGSGRSDVASTRRPSAVISVVAAFWSWLARPPVAAAFASVMAATLVGVMWWDRPLDETLPSATPPVASVRQSTTIVDRAAEQSKSVPAAPAEPAAISMPSTPSTPSTSSTSSTPTSPSTRPVPSKPPALEAKRAVVSVDRTLAEKSRAEATVQSAATTDANLDAARRPDTSATVTAAPQPFTAPVPPAALAKVAPKQLSASPPPPGTSRETTRSNPSGSDALGRVAPPPAPDVVSASPAVAAAPRTDSRARAAMAASVSPGTTRPLADVLGSLAAEPSRWSVQRANGERVPVDDAVRAWLTRVDGSGRWHASGSIDSADAAGTAATTSETAAAAPATTLTLMRDGRIDAVVRIDAGRVIVERRGETPAAPSTVVLSAPAAAALADSLPASAR